MYIQDVCIVTLFHTLSVYTGLFISPSGISELDCATNKTYTAEMSVSIGRESLHVFFVLGALAYFHVSPLGGSRDKKWLSQWIRKRSVSWNLPKLSQVWLCNGGFGSCTTQNHLQTKQFVISTEYVPHTSEVACPSTCFSSLLPYGKSPGNCVRYTHFCLCFCMSEILRHSFLFSLYSLFSTLFAFFISP